MEIKKTKKLILFILATSFLTISVYKGKSMFFTKSGLSVFDPQDSTAQIIPFQFGFKKKTFLIQPPANYDADITYPIVIALHGWTEDEKYYFRPLEEESRNSQKFPCFYMAPNNRTEGWGSNAEWARSIISDFINIYSVDITRVYIIGFSMGGSGSFSFAESLYEEYGITAAAILRCAGMSRPSLKEPLFSKTALWYSAGSKDSLEGVYETFRSSEKYYSENTQTFKEESHHIITYKNREINRTTISLSIKSGEANKYRFSLFSPMSHEYGPVFISDDVYEWLFLQSLEMID